MNTILANNFKSRTELENHVKGIMDLTPTFKIDYEISGKDEELRRLQLSSDCLFWGIKIVATDEEKKEDKKVADKVFRGEKFDYGINNRNNKIK